jgi:hypothetical protein
MALQSYKPYARIITLISSLIIIIASLDASQVINLFPEYANQINSILVICGLLAPAISQELRVVRAEDLIKEEYGAEEDNEISINLTLDGEDIIKDMEDDSSIDEETA